MMKFLEVSPGIEPGCKDEQSFDTQADLTMLWAYRPTSAASDPSALIEILRTLDLPTGTFVWIAAESSVMRAVRAHVEARGLPQGWLKASGYWVLGQADAKE